jgi:hypothetical protein
LIAGPYQGRSSYHRLCRWSLIFAHKQLYHLGPHVQIVIPVHLRTSGTTPLVAVRPEKSEPPTTAGTTPSTLNSARRWSMTTLRAKLIEIGAKVVTHSSVCDLPDGRGGGATRIVREDSGADSVVQCAATVGAARVTLVTEGNVGDARGQRGDAARKRAGLVDPEAAGAGLVRWSGQTGKNHGEKGLLRLSRVARPDTMAG